MLAQVQRYERRWQVGEKHRQKSKKGDAPARMARHRDDPEALPCRAYLMRLAKLYLVPFTLNSPTVGCAEDICA